MKEEKKKPSGREGLINRTEINIIENYNSKHHLKQSREVDSSQSFRDAYVMKRVIYKGENREKFKRGSN